VRQVGLLDAKEMVRQNADVLVGAAEAARLQAEAEAGAAAAEAEAEAEAAAAAAAEAEAGAEVPAAAAIPVAAPTAAAPGAYARVLDALKRSPLMLDLPADHPGLVGIAKLVRGLRGASFCCRFLLRLCRKQLFLCCKLSAAHLPLACAADQRKALSLADCPTPHKHNSHQQPDLVIIAGAAYLVRQEGLLDAKEMVRKSADVLVGAAEAARLQAEAEAAAAEAEAEAEAAAAAAAEAEAEAEVPAAAAIPVAAPIAAPPGAFAGVLDALKRSPLMLDLPATHPGLATIAKLVRGLSVTSFCCRVVLLCPVFKWLLLSFKVCLC
jgi:SWI/SNF-related matrix-associated actin-dependent regulator 1 of chromatin subfamily A